MPKQEKQTLLPKRRFPEFREAGEWKEKPLGQLAKRCAQKNRGGEVKRVLTNSAEYGVVDQRDYFDKDIATQGNLEGYFIVEKGDYVYNPRISTMAPVGPISKNNVATGVMSPLYTVFRFNNSNNDFYALYFKTTGWHHYMRQASSTGARHDRMAITNGDFMAMPLPVTLPGEHQKIADCLASLDELITLEAQKLDTLKIHKKGLMQQLFPAEGETLPKLHFPEFRDAGEWEPRCVSQLAKVTTGAKDTQNKVDGGRYPFFVRSQTVERIETFSYDGEAILTSGDGVGVGKNFHYIKGKFDFHQRVYCIYHFDEDVSGLFFYLYFSEHFGERVMRMSAKNSVDSVRMAMITEMPVMLPPSILEQQRIADCLTSLDDLITAQTQQLAALKIHKKGLMQQLFPDTATTPPLRGTPPEEGNKSSQASNSPPVEGWQAKPDGVVK